MLHQENKQEKIQIVLKLKIKFDQLLLHCTILFPYSYLLKEKIVSPMQYKKYSSEPTSYNIYYN